MRIIYFGSDVFFNCFKYIVESGHDVIGLYTYHDDGEYICEGGITDYARAHGIPVTYERMTIERATQLFMDGECDLFLSAEYDARIPVPNIACFRGVNIHNSLLPQGRGYFPIEMRLLYGYDYGGVTMHKLVPKLDRGAIVLQRRFDIAPHDDDRALYGRCAELALDMVSEFLDDMPGLWLRARRQAGHGSYWNKPTLAQRTIDGSMTSAQIAHIYRALGHFTLLRLNGEFYKVERVTCERDFSPRSISYDKKASDDMAADDNYYVTNNGKYVMLRIRDGYARVELQANERAINV